MLDLIDGLHGEATVGCRCVPVFEGDRLVVDADACPGAGQLATEPDCRATVVSSLCERDAEVVTTRAAGTERAYEDGAVALLVAAGRFAEKVEVHDEALAAQARSDPLGAAREATGRAGPPARIAAESGLAETAARADGYETALRPYVGPTISRARVATRPPPDADLVASRELDTGTVVRIYDRPTAECRTYHLEPVEHGLDADGTETLVAAYDRLASGAVSGSERAPGRAVRRVADAGDDVRALEGVLRKHTMGYGVLTDLFADPLVTDVFATAPTADNRLRVRCDGDLLWTNVRLTERGVCALASRFRRESGRAFSRANPTLDATATPAAETAAAFAAEAGRGPLADSLDDHVRRAEGRPGSGLSGFSAEWAEWFPALRRALLLVESAATAPDGERERTLDRALQVILDGTRDRMTEFAAGLRGPTTALYAFGVVLPLALVALLPAARTTGVSLPLSAVVFLYDVALPGVILIASVWLLARRPVTFPPPTVDRAHPDLSNRRWPHVVAGVVAGIVGWLAATGIVTSWAGPIAALGCSLGAGLVVRYRPVMAVRDHVQAVESGLADALYYVGRRVEEGRAVEAAVVDAANEVHDPTGEVLADAARRQRQIKVGLREAFLGEHGALAHVPSTRTRSAVALLALAAREGRPAGGAVVAMADNLAELASVETDARHEIATVTSTLANTAAVFGPLVAGATVALAASMEVGGRLAASGGPSASGLGLAVGGYVLVLAALLAALSTGLSRGLDRALVGYRVGWTLLSATATYLATFFAVGTLV